MNTNNSANIQKLSYKKKILFSLLPLFILLILSEVGIRCYYYQIKAGYPLALIHILHSLKFRIGSRIDIGVSTSKIVVERSMFKDDSMLGYSYIPGVHPITIIVNDKWSLLRKEWNFNAIIGEDGLRTTSENPAHYIDKPEIWIFGCSFTWGWPLDNEDTFPWLIQEKLPDYRVRNFGGGGYGNTTALLQFKQYLKEKKPAISVFVYNSFHLTRNVAAPSRLRAIRRLHEMSGDMLFHFPRAFINEDGKLEVKIIPLVPVDGPDPPVAYMHQVTMMIFKELKELCGDNVVPVLAFQLIDKDDPVVYFCEKIGFTIVDMSLKLTNKYRLLPFDSHPNPEAHKIYAQKLLVGLKKIIEANEH